MKGLMIFAALVLGYSMLNIVHIGASAATYKVGIDAYMKHQAERSNSSYNRSPAIVKNK
jgi:hypothetical protein